ncbi:Zona pellucida-binding protein 1 [Pteropus alecto]|uniref:Zona pellucida-binding protein 1 n=1 Tax=Pteropus alecto TaxID=9402 RepID=L5KP31_PTEAL|nr:Zona pellucida-binding protein 1 [Pteropus alecto]
MLPSKAETPRWRMSQMARVQLRQDRGCSPAPGRRRDSASSTARVKVLLGDNTYARSIQQNSTAQITSTGSLVFQNFEEGMTGVYTCFLEYKPTVEEVVKNLQLKYVVYDFEKGRKPCVGRNCDATRRLSKAKNLIERFFNQQVEVLGRRAEPLPEIYYIEGTLHMVWINRCFPGYGINTLKHPRCPECCGMY